MTDFVRRRPILSAVVGFSSSSCCSAVSRSFPKPNRPSSLDSANPSGSSTATNPVGRSASASAGLSFRIPFLDQIVWIDKRVLAVDMEPQPVLSTDQRRLMVDAFARYRIVDPLFMYIRSRSPENLEKPASDDPSLRSP